MPPPEDNFSRINQNDKTEVLKYTKLTNSQEDWTLNFDWNLGAWSMQEKLATVSPQHFSCCACPTLHGAQ